MKYKSKLTSLIYHLIIAGVSAYFINVNMLIDLPYAWIGSLNLLLFLSFGFDKNKEPFIENLNFSLVPGQSIAFAGLIGSGKSTLLNVLKGVYEPWGGQILYDNISLYDVGSNLFVEYNFYILLNQQYTSLFLLQY